MKSGKLTLIVGCMFAEKTTELIRLYRRAIRAKQSCMMVKHGKDVRYSNDSVVSHDDDRETAIVCNKSCEILKSIEGSQKPHNIFFDEGQFFEDLPKTCEHLMRQGINVYVSALRSDFRRNPFPVVSTLLARANGGIVSLTAICSICGAEATESKLIANVDLHGKSEFIGGSESYSPVCLDCYWDH